MSAPATTASLLTAPARGGIAVIVLKGPGTRRIVREIFRPRRAGPDAGTLSLGWIVAGEDVLDEAIVTLSRHRTDLAEINIHGGPHVARKVLTLLARHGAEVASDEPADAALAGPHPDLNNPAVACEMLSALRHASTPLAAAAVTAQWSGGLSALAASRRIDPRGLRLAAGALGLMKRLLFPAEVVVAGPPNVGKSALANGLLGRNVSIVSDTPGTTRDWVRTLTEAGGVPIWLTDTAGLWEAEDGIGGEAVRRAWGRIESADLVVCVIAGPADPRHGELLARLRGQKEVLNVSGKCDATAPAGDADVAVSAQTSVGIEELRRAIRERLGFDRFDPTAPMAFADRQARLLTSAADAAEAGDEPRARLILRELLGNPQRSGKSSSHPPAALL